MKVVVLISVFFTLTLGSLCSRAQYSIGESFLFGFDKVSLTYWGCSSSGALWFQSGPYLLGNTTLSPPRGTPVSFFNASDSLGAYQGISLTWNKGHYVNLFRLYKDFIVFEQHWPHGEGGNISTYSGWTPCTDQFCPGVPAVISGFPTLSVVPSEERNFLSFAGYDMIDTGVGRWGHSEFRGSTVSGMPLILFNRHLQTLIVSPLSHFMTSAQVWVPSFKAVSCGPNGKVNWLPTNYRHETVLVFGQGVNNTLFRWGDVLLQRGGVKGRPSLYRGKSNQGLSYSTGNGAYYYYNPLPNRTYQDTLLAIKKSFQLQRVPMLNYELDSWWYYRNSTTDNPSYRGDGGLLLWEPRPDVFPSLNMSFLESPLWLHGRYVDPFNWYRKPNTSFTFLSETGNPWCVLPVDEKYFLHLFSEARKWGYGDVVYEQDWMAFQFGQLNLTQDNVVNAERWVDAIGAAAQKTQVFTMWDSPLASQIMDSTRHSMALQASSAMDYMPGNSQWRNGWNNMFYWSLGLIPWKDSFWSSSVAQPHCVYSPHCRETNPLLQALVAVLTGGPVTLGDAINSTNVTLVAHTIRSDGLLLKPDTCGTFLEKTFLIDFDAPLNVEGLVTASTQIFRNYGCGMWQYVLSANLTQSISVSLNDLSVSHNQSWISYNFFSRQWTYVSQNEPLVLPSNIIPPWNNATDCNLPPCDQTIDFSYHVLCPVAGMWALVGESDKFITMSRARFNVQHYDDSIIMVDVVVATNEVVNILLINTATGELLSVTCSGNNSTLICKNGATCECV